MIVKCIDNKDVESFITAGKEYKVKTKYAKGYGVICDNAHEFPFHFARFEVIDGDLSTVEAIEGEFIQVTLEKPLERKKPKKNNLMSAVFGGISK